MSKVAAQTALDHLPQPTLKHRVYTVAGDSSAKRHSGPTTGHYDSLNNARFGLHFKIYALGDSRSPSSNLQADVED